MIDLFVPAATAIIGAVAGVAAKAIYDRRAERREAAVNRARDLRRLDALLRQSRDIFENQNFKARALRRTLADRAQGAVDSDESFNDLFIRVYSQMTPAEREIHALIRGTTMNSMYPVNKELVSWLDHFSWDASGWGDEGKALLHELRNLQKHLHDWVNQYHSLFLQDDRHSLVYTADEKRHGRGFPRNLGPALERVLQRVL